MRMRAMFPGIAMTTTNVAQSKRPGHGQAKADLLLGKANSWRKFNRQRLASGQSFGQSFAQHLNLGDRHQRDAHDSFHAPTEQIVKPDWQGKHQRLSSGHPSHPPNGLAQRERFGPDDGNSFPRERSVHERGFGNSCDVFNRVGPDGLVLEADKSEHRKCVKRVAEMIEHVIAFAVNDAALQHRVVQAGVTHDFLGLPLRFVIARTAIRSCPEKTDQKNFFNSRSMCGRNNIARPFNVDFLIGRAVNFPIDSRAVRDRVASSKGPLKLWDILQTERMKVRPMQGTDCCVRVIVSAGEKNDFVSLRRESARNVPPDEAGAASDCDFHVALPVIATHA